MNLNSLSRLKNVPAKKNAYRKGTKYIYRKQKEKINKNPALEFGHNQIVYIMSPPGRWYFMYFYI